MTTTTRRTLLALLCLLLLLMTACSSVSADVPSSAYAIAANATLPPAAENQDWNVTLVNADASVPEDWQVELVELRGGEQVDRRIIDALQEMFDACRAEGLYPIVNAGYRSREEQQALFDRELQKNALLTDSAEEAEAMTRQWVALPGTSEHELGIAVDIVAEDTANNDALWQWLHSNCAQYGFILRYPDGKSEITGISYEAWHFRYVGKDAATEIMTQGLTLEEYIGSSE